jgi:hypothetical protein
MKKIRLFLAAVILALSIALLVWAYSPNPRETRVQPIAPSEMQLP